MLDKEDKIAALSDKKEAYVGSQVLLQPKIRRRILVFVHRIS
jgi:hypothetical protein